MAVRVALEVAVVGVALGDVVVGAALGAIGAIEVGAAIGGVARLAPEVVVLDSASTHTTHSNNQHARERDRERVTVIT